MKMNHLKSIAYQLLNDIIIMDLITDFGLYYYKFTEDKLIVQYKDEEFEVIYCDEEPSTYLYHIYVYDLIYHLRKIKLNYLYTHQPDFIEFCLEPNRNDARNLNLDEFIIIQKNAKTLQEM